jgi:hypothetical protein
MATTPTLILIAITHTRMVIMVFGHGSRVTGIMVGVGPMVTGVIVDGGEAGFRVIGGIADSTFFG